MATLVGQTVSHYKVLEHLGSGGMGVVYKAEDLRLDRPVALKFLPPEFTHDADARRRFIQEAKAASALQHPNICVVYDIGETPDGQIFISMEYLDGATLKEKIELGPLDSNEAISIAMQLAQGLKIAHDSAIIHRDIKPANVFVTSSGIVKILDFGLAKLAGAHTRLTKVGSTLGTVAYMSPEQSMGEVVDGRTDLWSLGVVLYEMLTGQLPFKGEHEQALLYLINNEDPNPVDALVPGISPELTRIVTHALEKKPELRYSTADQVLEDLKKYGESLRPSGGGGFSLPALLRALRKPRVAIPATVALVALGLGAAWFFNRQAQVRWARDLALPEIERMIAENDVWRNLVPPYRLAERAEDVLGDDPELAGLFSRCGLHINVRTDPAGARVYMKEYSDPDGEWIYLGDSPLEKVRVPVGIFRWKIEKEGYETVLVAASTWSVTPGSETGTVSSYDLVRKLDALESIPTGMVRVPATKTEAGDIDDFFIDRYEVRNKEYRLFVNAGGYRKKEYWKHPFVSDGRELTWEEAMSRFVDRSNQPGPSTWLAGDYPQGQADYPVSGLSWYEAAAYAEFAGKSLPTMVHWNVARGALTPMLANPQLGGFAVLAPYCNFGGSGPVAVGSLRGITAYGTFDMAGNVREWCWNATQQGRLIRGGAWDDNSYEFGNPRQAPAMNRSPKNGFRLAVYLDRNSIPESAFAFRQFFEPTVLRTQKPVPDAIFSVYRDLFSYDNTALNAKVDDRFESSGGWIRERVSFDAAYGDERVQAYLFLPTNSLPPYQTVVYFPGGAATLTTSSQDIENYYEFSMFLSFLVRNGRAVLFPIYKGTFERASPALRTLHRRSETHAYTELLVQQIKDFRRSVDYLHSRPDIDSGKIAYYGMSWGGALGLIIPAVEGRLAASVLVAGGAPKGRTRPEASEISYVTRVVTPTLMLNGRYDSIFDFNRRVKPVFDLLGTPAEHKRLILYDTDHLPPRTEYIKETLAWFDRYLGSVR